MVKGSSHHSIGRRKSAVARVFLKNGSGSFLVNGREPMAYFGRANLDIHLREPLAVAKLADKYDVSVNVQGGGKAGQAGAIRMALGRALILVDSSLRGVLKAAGVLTRDSREVERKKYGRHKARKRPQYSKR